MTVYPSRVRCLGAGATGARPAAHSRVADPLVRGLWSQQCSCAPRQRRRGAMSRRASVEERGLPKKGRQLAGAGHRGHVGRLAPAHDELLPLVLQALLGAPGQLTDPWVLAVLAAAQLFRSETAGRRQTCLAASTSSRRECSGPAFVIAPWRRRSSEVRSEGTRPRKPASWFGLANRAKSPTSAQRPIAARVSIPRKQRRRAIVSAHGLSGATSPRTRSSASRRWARASTAAP